MNNDYTGQLKIRGFALSEKGCGKYTVFYFAGMLFLQILLAGLIWLFPGVMIDTWVLFVPFLLPFVGAIVHFLFCMYTVTLSKEGLMVRWFGFGVNQLRASELQLLCAAGNLKDDVLCLSCYTQDQLAQLQEKRYLRKPLDKHNVPLLKRNPHWQEKFAGEYMNVLRSKPFGMRADPGVVQLPMSAGLQCLVRRMYPWLPYKNYTAVTSAYTNRYCGVRENEAFSLSTRLYSYTVLLQQEGLRLLQEKREILFIPAERLQTAYRVDIFRGYDKHHPHHRPLLLISCLTQAQMAAQAPDCTAIDETLPENQELLAMLGATKLAACRSKNRTDYVVMHYTENNVQMMKDLFPHVQLNRLSESWLQNS